MNIEERAPSTPANVLIVDDDEFNRLCLTAPLERLDYRVSEAIDGQEALDKVAANPPDLILLDLMLPKVDGIEVCRRLKQDPATQMIPIIMVTVLDDQGHRIRAIEAGANDFLNKPIDLHEVVLRVNNAVKAKKTYDELQESYRRLKEIRHAQRELTDMIVHDIRSPLSVALGHMDLLMTDTESRLGQEDRSFVQNAIEGIHQISNMSHTLLSVQGLESGGMPLQKKEVDMVQLCRKLLGTFQHLFSDRRLELECPDDLILFSCDEEMMLRVLTNLVVNAKKFTEPNGLIRLHLKKTRTYLTIICEDDGRGIPASFLPRVFDKYTRAEDVQDGTGIGLGLAFCKLAVEAHGGRIDLESDEGKGTRVILSLPFL